MQNVYANFDGLDMAFFGNIPEEILTELGEAKEAARLARADQPVEYAGRVFMVTEAGARGGFRYTLKTGEDGATYFLMGENKPEGRWMVKASANSAAFAQLGNGLEPIRDMFVDDLECLGFIPKTCPKDRMSNSVSRVDFAADFLLPKVFALDPEAIVFKGGKTVHRAEDDGREKDVTEHWRGSRCTGLTIGKMPNRQCVIYDKVADINAKGKDYWWQVWGLDKDDCEGRVWRVEMRAGKKFLRDVWKLRTFDDVSDAIADLMADSLDKIRYVMLGADSNRSRCPDAELWTAMRNVIAQGAAGLFNGLCPNAVREAVQERFEVTMETLLKGVALTYGAVTAGAGGIEAVISEIKFMLGRTVERLEEDTEDAQKRAIKARDRYRIIEWKEWEKRTERTPPEWLSNWRELKAA